MWRSVFKLLAAFGLMISASVGAADLEEDTPTAVTSETGAHAANATEFGETVDHALQENNKPSEIKEARNTTPTHATGRPSLKKKKHKKKGGHKKKKRN